MKNLCKRNSVYVNSVYNVFVNRTFRLLIGFWHIVYTQTADNESKSTFVNYVNQIFLMF